MARYRKLEVAVWTDDVFQEMSAPPPNGQTLWIYLLTGPRTTQFPGLVVAREEVMASDLRWSLEGFREAFREASSKGLVKVDRKAGLVWLTKALLDSSGEPRTTSRPESPNVIRGWAKSWDEIPECSLKNDYLRELETFSSRLDDDGEAFAKAFAEAFRKALGKASRQASPHPSPNQDQEQETGSGGERGATAPPPLALNSPLAKPKRAVRSKAVEISLPADWTPNESHTAKARNKNIDLAFETGQFTNTAVAKAKTYVDWNAAFHTWLDKSAKWAAERNTRSGGHSQAGQPLVRIPVAKPRPTEDIEP